MSKTQTAIKLGDHTFREFDQLDALLGATPADYPPFETIPEEHRRNRSLTCDIASKLFYRGGSLDQYDRKIKNSEERDFTGRFLSLYRGLACSFAPKHEHKIATLGWLIAEHTEPKE